MFPTSYSYKYKLLCKCLLRALTIALNKQVPGFVSCIVPTPNYKILSPERLCAHY